jgi:hypothetical protein
LRDISDEGNQCVAGQIFHRWVDVFGDDQGAARMQQLRNGTTNTAGSARHDNGFTFDFIDFNARLFACIQPT